jgi:uracil-DNA glycosylase
MSYHAKMRPADIVRFYLEAGIETPLLNEPVNRLADLKPAAEAAKAGIATAETTVKSAAMPIIADVDVSTAQTLEQLKAMIEAYDGCGLKKTATQVVFDDGVPGSPVMLVGEAPGRDEDIQGKPFVGKSGQLLDLMLKAIGLDRGSVYIANTIYWRPPGNRPPTAEESAQCLPFIRRQIELAKPKIVVFVGGVSAKTMLNTKDGIMQLRGNWTELSLPELGTLPCLPTLHPAYLLRNPAHKRLAWADWLSLKMRLKSPV